MAKALDKYPWGYIVYLGDNHMRSQFKWLIGAVILVLGLGAALFYAQPKDQDHSQMPAQVSGSKLDLALDPPNYDFGTISMKNGFVTKSFHVKNIQNQEIDLSTVYTSCMCTTAKIIIDSREYGPFAMQGHGTTKMLNQKLRIGQEAQLLVTYDPNAHGPSGIGRIERTVSLESKQGDIANIIIKANVTP